MKNIKEIPTYEVLCPYCLEFAERVWNEEIYGKRFGHGLAYLCRKCDAYVGCHKTGEPLGTPADKETRYWRKLAHTHFDQLWKSATNMHKVRNKWYQRLAHYMELPTEKTHIGMFNQQQCKKVLLFVDDIQSIR